MSAFLSLFANHGNPCMPFPANTLGSLKIEIVPQGGDQ